MRMREPRNHTESMSEVQPETASPAIYETRAQTATTISISISTIPMMKIKVMGRAVNDVIPSAARASRRVKLYFDSPALRTPRG